MDTSTNYKPVDLRMRCHQQRIISLLVMSKSNSKSKDPKGPQVDLIGQVHQSLEIRPKNDLLHQYNTMMYRTMATTSLSAQKEIKKDILNCPDNKLRMMIQMDHAGPINQMMVMMIVSHFSQELRNAHVPSHLVPSKIPKYEGKCNLAKYLNNYKTYMS